MLEHNQCCSLSYSPALRSFNRSGALVKEKRFLLRCSRFSTKNLDKVVPGLRSGASCLAFTTLPPKLGRFPLIRMALQMGVGACAELLECFFQRPSLGPAFSTYNSADGFQHWHDRAAQQRPWAARQQIEQASRPCGVSRKVG